MTIWFASRFSPTYQGGLAAYERSVIQGIQQRKCISFKVIYAVARIDSLPAAQDIGELPVTELGASLVGRVSRPLWTRFASRPALHHFLETILARAWRRPQIVRPSVIHYVGTGWDFFGFAMARLAREYQARFVITPAIHPGSWGSDRIDGRLYRQADGVICFTHQEGQFLEQLGVEKQKLFVCPLPPTCRTNGDGLRFRKETHLDGQPCVLFLGRRDEGKGYPALLQAWPLVLRTIPEAVLILAGAAGGQYGELVAKIPPPNIRDIGVPDEVRKADAIAACDVFCLPSAHESFGIVYIDAWFYCKPVICGIAPACREFIADGETGLWANQVPEQLAEKLRVLLQNKSLREAMGAAGKRAQAERFNESIFVRNHLDAFGLSSLAQKSE